MKISTILTLFLMIAMQLPVYTQSAERGKLLWADEFDYTGSPDSSRWGYDMGDGCPNACGWGNNEWQYYTNRPENVRVEKGRLVITARKESFGGKEYTSTRMVSKNKGDWTYGRMEVRARLPYGRGVWPAIWMLPTDWSYGGWPASGEIDIMEHVGYNPDSIFGSVHTKSFNHIIGTQSTAGIKVKKLYRRFHVYAVDWRKDRIDFFVDGKRYHSFLNNGGGPDAWPFDRRFHFILNIAVGGNWGAVKGVDPEVWPQRMEVDYVRVYE